jgi:hypothetical protein
MRAINSGQASYAATAASGGYASDLTVLGDACGGGTEGFISSDMSAAATVQKSGYNVTLAAGAGALPGPNDCNSVASSTTYYASAEAVTLGSTGARAFATNQAGTIWQDAAGTPPPEPFTAGGTISVIQ